MEAEPKDVVRVRKIVKDFRPGFGLRAKRILHDISFDVKDGEIFGFVGPNGAGKTTTLKVMMGLIRPTSGTATILGHGVHETAFREHVGFLPENPYFYDHLTGREILTFYAKLGGVPRSQIAERTDTLLEWVHLRHAGDARLRTYSKGMLQRVGIAQALVHDPKVVFLDEPMSGLDPIGRMEIRDLILRLKEEGKTVFMNTHILSDVELLCDRVAIIVQGRIRYLGRIQDFLGEGEHQSEIVVKNLEASAALRLEESYGVTLTGLGDHLKFRVGEKDVDDAIDVVRAAGGNVLSVTALRVGLEEVFMSAVRGGAR